MFTLRYAGIRINLLEYSFIVYWLSCIPILRTCVYMEILSWCLRLSGTVNALSCVFLCLEYAAIPAAVNLLELLSFLPGSPLHFSLLYATPVFCFCTQRKNRIHAIRKPVSGLLVQIILHFGIMVPI